MITADHEAELLRGEISRVIGALREQGVSKMDAYERIGAAAGKSESWVRKHHGRNPSVGVRLRDFLNIRAAYDRLCARVEATAVRVDALADALETYADAPAARDARPHPRPGAGGRGGGPRAGGRPRAVVRYRCAPLIPFAPLVAAA